LPIMKTNKFNIYATWLTLLVFIWLQLPATLFHHHEHEPACELSREYSTAGKTHFHTNEKVECFVCSAHFTKDFKSVTPGKVIAAKIAEHYQLFAYEIFHSFHFSGKSNRAPPTQLL
jgi:hypothetical protein